MVDRGFSEAPAPAMVTREEKDGFVTYTVPVLTAVSTGELGYSEWRDATASAIRKDALGSISPVEAAFDGIGPIHALFAFLAMGVAYRLGSGGTSDQAVSGNAPQS